jgi:hypothetical protein
MYNDEEIANADVIETWGPNGEAGPLLWGPNDGPLISSLPGTPALEMIVRRIYYTDDSQLLQEMERVIRLKGRLPQAVLGLYAKLKRAAT